MLLASWRVVGAIIVVGVSLCMQGIDAFARINQPTFQTAAYGEFCKLSVATRDTSVDMTNDTSVSSSDDAHYNANEWQEYETTIRTVMDNGRMVKRKDKPEDVSRAIDYLLNNDTLLPLPNLSDTINSRETMNTQKLAFLSKANLTETQHELAMRTLTYLGDYCAKTKRPTPLVVAWHKLQEAGMVPRENCISTYMYVLSLLNSSTAQDVASFHDLFYKANEKTITLRIKSMIANNDAAGAQELLRLSVEKNDGEWKKLRTYTPVLELYCNQGDMTSALGLYRQMQELSRVHFEPDTYALLMSALAEQGHFCKDAIPIPRARELGFSKASGPGLFDELATEMAADILELNNASARILYNGFVKGFSSAGATLADQDDELEVDNTPAAANELAIGRVSLNDATATCPKTGAKLQLFQLDNEQRRSVHDTLLEMAGIQYEKFLVELEARFKQNMKHDEGRDFAVRELLRFSDWLNEREGEPFTAIVDGPNIAYFGHGSVHYSQVKHVVDELERMNERPLVVMPQKYTSRRFNVNIGSTQELSEQDLEALNELNETGKLYTVPSKCLDDYYWMLASTSNQTKAAGGRDLSVSISKSNGRFPGLRPMLVTNDQMRDHRWDLLEPRLFRRWCSCHIVNYNFSQFVVDEWAPRDVDFCAADFFSNEIQGNPSPGSDVNSTPGLAWHFPVSGWDEHDRLCIRLPL